MGDEETVNVSDVVSCDDPGQFCYDPYFNLFIQGVLFVVVFGLSLAGNALVISTLIGVIRMRTVTNSFLLSLSVSDLLLSLCMPFTLAHYASIVFGDRLDLRALSPALCRAIPYLQAVTVNVSASTLTAISIERYFAILEPLRSRAWQTLSHSYWVILATWLLAAAVCFPLLLVRNATIHQGQRVCHEEWPADWVNSTYTLVLVTLNLFVPVIVMSVTYTRIIVHLRTVKNRAAVSVMGGGGSCSHESVLRRDETIKNRQKLIRMLVVIVLMYFVCWTPLHLLQIVYVLHSQAIHTPFMAFWWPYLHALSYVSGCCNPVIYSFMSAKFRESFSTVIRCFSAPRRPQSALRRRRQAPAAAFDIQGQPVQGQLPKTSRDLTAPPTPRLSATTNFTNLPPPHNQTSDM